jgi:hypothetical protein
MTADIAESLGQLKQCHRTGVQPWGAQFSRRGQQRETTLIQKNQRGFQLLGVFLSAAKFA